MHLLRWALVGVVTLGAASAAWADEDSLTKEDRAAFAWFDGIGLPSTRDKPLVRIRWENAAAPADAPAAERVWELDGFVVAERDGVMTVLDPDLWARNIERAPPGDWRGEPTERNLREFATTCIARLRAMVDDPGAVESLEQLYRGTRRRVGEEGLAFVLARHCAENGLEREAAELLAAARALPPVSASAAARPLREVVAEQIHETVLWRIVFDFADPTHSRAELLGRLQSWLASFPKSPHRERAEHIVTQLAPMVEEDASRTPPDADASVDQRARDRVWQLRDQRGDVESGWFGAFFVQLHGEDTPVDRVVELGAPAIPHLIEALVDPRPTRMVFYRLDMAFGRQHLGGIGDAARIALERIAGQSFWKPTPEAPSMFGAGVVDDVQRQWREWYDASAGFGNALQAVAAAEDADERMARIAALPDRGCGPIGGNGETVWGTRSCLAALPGVDEAQALEFLHAIVAHGSRPRTRALAAWAAHDLGSETAVPSMIELWRSMSDGDRADPEQGGTVISFLGACGDVRAIRALADGLDKRAPAVRVLAVLSFGRSRLGAVRGFAADRPDGVRVDWDPEDDVARAIEELVAARLVDTEEDPLSLIPRQEPLCDIVPEYDCGRRIADGAIRVLNLRFPEHYAAPDEPARPRGEWESLRTKFQQIAAGRSTDAR